MDAIGRLELDKPMAVSTKEAASVDDLIISGVTPRKGGVLACSTALKITPSILAFTPVRAELRV